LLSDADSSCQAVWSCTYYDRIIFVAIRHYPSLSLALDGWMRQGQEREFKEYKEYEEFKE
jgi:hypothetical protein